MLQAGDGLGLALKARPQIWVGRKVRRQYLDGDSAVEPRIAGLIDLAHATSAGGSLHFIGTELGSGIERHECSGVYLNCPVS